MKKASRPDAVGVRLATPADAAVISEILLAAFGEYRSLYTPESFAIVTPGPDEIVNRFDEGPQWVALIDHEIVATVSVTDEPEGLYIRSMAVRPLVQGTGVGHKLLAAIDEYTAGTDATRVFLYTTYFGTGARELYEKRGFRWVRDTTADEWYGTPGLEMEKIIERTSK